MKDSNSLQNNNLHYLQNKIKDSGLNNLELMFGKYYQSLND